MKKFVLGGIAALVFVMTPAAEAFNKGATDAESYAAPDAGVALYVFTVPLGAWNEDMYLPVLGERSLPYASRENRFGFELESGYPQGVTDAGVAGAFMIANAPIENGYYKFPAYSLASFKIVVPVRVDADEGNIYRARITELPFLRGLDKRPGHFSDAEIKYLVTSFEPLYFDQDSE